MKSEAVFLFGVFVLTQARLLLHQQVFNKHVVVGKEILVQYSIFNTASETAFNVTLKSQFNETHFDILAGSPAIMFAQIGGKAEAIHVIVIIPKLFGSFRSDAVISYDQNGSRRNGFIEHQEIIVHKLEGYCRKYCCDFSEFVLILLVYALPIVIPFALFYVNRNIKILV